MPPKPSAAPVRRVHRALPPLLALLCCAQVHASDGAGNAKGAGGPGTGVCSAALGCQVVRPGFFDCDNASIGAALAASSTVEIRVVAGSSAENIAVADRSVTIIGGYPDCPSARDGMLGTPDAVTTIDAGGSSTPTVNITAATASPRDVQLYRLAITGTAAATQGALRIDGTPAGDGTLPLRVRLGGVRVHGNSATLGGGVYLREAQLDLGGRVEGNSASQRGGGVYCLDARMDVLPGSAVADNSAVLDGGGIYASGCFVGVYGAGGAWSVTPLDDGIRRNAASLGSGGGIFASNGTHVDIGAANNFGESLTTIRGNRANALDGGSGELGGGGLYLTGLGTQLTMSNTLLLENAAGSASPAPAAAASVGGAIAVVENASARIEDFGPVPICDATMTPGEYLGLCTTLQGNAATGAGAALYAFNATVSAWRLNIVDNRSGNGGVLQFGGSGLKTVETSLLARNVAFGAGRALRNVIAVDSGAAILRSLTLADNQHTTAALGTGLANVDVRASLFDDIRSPAPPALAWDAGAPPALACVRVPAGSTLPAGAVESTVGIDAGFTPQARAATDYRLKSNSPMVDACSTSQYSAFAPAVRDSDLEVRGVDITSEPDEGGPVDVGMDEVVPIDLFSDGFEDLIPM